MNKILLLNRAPFIFLLNKMWPLRMFCFPSSPLWGADVCSLLLAMCYLQNLSPSSSQLPPPPPHVIPFWSQFFSQILPPFLVTFTCDQRQSLVDIRAHPLYMLSFSRESQTWLCLHENLHCMETSNLELHSVAPTSDSTTPRVLMESLRKDLAHWGLQYIQPYPHCRLSECSALSPLQSA